MIKPLEFPIKKCSHQFPSKIKVIESSVNCETTVEVCPLCGEHLSQPKTEC